VFSEVKQIIKSIFQDNEIMYNHFYCMFPKFINFFYFCHLFILWPAKTVQDMFKKAMSKIINILKIPINYKDDIYFCKALKSNIWNQIKLISNSSQTSSFYLFISVSLDASATFILKFIFWECRNQYINKSSEWMDDLFQISLLTKENHISRRFCVITVLL